MSTNRAKQKETKGKRAAAAAVSTVQVTFEGMMMLFVNPGTGYCDVGILKHAPHHAANILIVKIPEFDPPETMLHLNGDEFEPRMWLDVEKFEAGITLYKDNSNPFRRDDDDNPLDFRWALDFEGDEMYQVKIAVDPAGFRSILRINDGTFCTQKISTNNLIKKPWNATPETVGRVAVKLRADITLDGVSAYFQNGVNHTPLELKAEENVNYRIYVSQVRDHHAAEDAHADSDEIDAENYNYAVAVDLPYNRKIHFAASSQRIDPDARCLIGVMGQTELPPG